MEKLPDSAREASGRSKITIYLAGGQTLDTWVDDEDFCGDDGDELDAEHIRDHISDPPRPHWSIIGDVCVFTQAISAVEVG